MEKLAPGPRGRPKSSPATGKEKSDISSTSKRPATAAAAGSPLPGNVPPSGGEMLHVQQPVNRDSDGGAKVLAAEVDNHTTEAVAVSQGWSEESKTLRVSEGPPRYSDLIDVEEHQDSTPVAKYSKDVRHTSC